MTDRCAGTAGGFPDWNWPSSFEGKSKVVWLNERGEKQVCVTKTWWNDDCVDIREAADVESEDHWDVWCTGHLWPLPYVLPALLGDLVTSPQVGRAPGWPLKPDYIKFDLSSSCGLRDSFPPLNLSSSCFCSHVSSFSSLLLPPPVVMPVWRVGVRGGFANNAADCLFATLLQRHLQRIGNKELRQEEEIEFEGPTRKMEFRQWG